MPRIIPIRDLKNTSEISELCHNSSEPVFVTKNGYGDMVIMSMDVYEKTMFLNDVLKKLGEAEASIEKNEVVDGFEAMEAIRAKYGI